MTNVIVTGADQLRAGNGIKDPSNETSRAPLCAHRKVYFQAKGARTEINWHGGASVSCSNVPVLSINSANKKVSREDPDNGRCALSVNKKDESTKVNSAGCSLQASVHWKVTTTEYERPNSDVKKENKRSRTMSAGCSTPDGEDKTVRKQEVECLSFGVGKRKKRSKAAYTGCSNQTAASDRKINKETTQRTECNATSPEEFVALESQKTDHRKDVSKSTY